MHKLTDGDSVPEDVKEDSFCPLEKYTIEKAGNNVVNIVRWLGNSVVTVASITFS